MKLALITILSPLHFSSSSGTTNSNSLHVWLPDSCVHLVLQIVFFLKERESVKNLFRGRRRSIIPGYHHRITTGSFCYPETTTISIVVIRIAWNFKLFQPFFHAVSTNVAYLDIFPLHFLLPFLSFLSFFFTFFFFSGFGSSVIFDLVSTGALIA